MEQIKLELPELEYKRLPWKTLDNVTPTGRSRAFENQNLKYKLAGFTKDNTTYSQSFEVHEDTKKFASTLFDRYTVSVMWQMPGHTLPSHVDTFYMISKEFDVEPEKCCRVNIFLEDWISGHYFEINENPILQWTRGDAIIIEKDEPHLSGNFGLKPKYTMQVTGVRDEFKRG
tara:strand:+ start:4106 stop:4624 length:519 start_codon:yes stop_codon:yes gene_type:complete